MTEQKQTKETWLPNLVGGVSIWKLAADLNQERFFDGRLLVPETEGSDSLPVKVLWSVDDLVPLAVARTQHAEAVGVATTEFLACVERVKKELSSEASGYKKFREAFSIPALDAEGEANYFFDPKSGKLCVINWGASPRSMAGKGEIVFGYDRFEELIARAKSAAAPAALAAAATGGADAAGGAGGDPKKEAPQEAKKDEDEKKKRSLWFWLAIALGIIVAIIVLGLLFHSCNESEEHLDAGASASPSASASSSASAAKDAGPDAADAGKDAANDAGDGGDAGADASDGGDAGADASDGKDGGDGGDAGGKDAGKDGGAAGVDNSGTTPQNGKVYVIQGDGGFASPGGALMPDGTPWPRPSKPLPFRSHYQPDATAWRITKGADLVDPDFPPVMNNGAFDVFLKPGHTFSEITVEYQDKNGSWHTH